MLRKLCALAVPVLFVLSLFAFAPSSAQAQGLTLKLFGAYTQISGGDFRDGTKGPIDWYKAVFTIAGWGVSGNFKDFNSSWEGGGDLIFYLSPMIGIGFGGGYMQTLPAKTEVTMTHPPDPTAFMSLNPKVTVIPVRASLYVSIPMGTMLNLTLHGGVSYYFARAQFAWRLGQVSDWIQVENKADGKGLGFHGGAGLEFNLSPSAALVLEAAGRIATFSGFTGDATLSTSGGSSASDSGTLYYWRYDYGSLGIYPEVGVRDPAPSGANFSDVREAEINLNGFSVRAGFLFRF